MYLFYLLADVSFFIVYLLIGFVDFNFNTVSMQLPASIYLFLFIRMNKIQVMLRCKFLNKLMVLCQLSNQYKLPKLVSTFFFLISMFPEIKFKACIPLKNFCNFCWHFHINSQGCQTLKLKLK